MTCQIRSAFGLFGALGFLVLAAAAPSQPREVPTCDLEIRFVDNQYQWRCSLEAAPCVQCDIDGTCVRHPGGVPPLPGQVECRCKTATDYQFDTCYGVIEITESGVDVLCFNSSACECAEFCLGAPLPCCVESGATGDWEMPCNCLRGTEDKGN